MRVIRGDRGAAELEQCPAGATIPIHFTGEIASGGSAVVFPVTIYREDGGLWVLFHEAWRSYARAAGLVDRGYDLFDERIERVINRLIRWQFRAHEAGRWSLARIRRLPPLGQVAS